MLRNTESGEETVLNLSKEQETDESHYKDNETGAELKVIEKMPLLEFLANSYKKFGCQLEFITNKSQVSRLRPVWMPLLYIGMQENAGDVKRHTLVLAACSHWPLNLAHVPDLLDWCMAVVSDYCECQSLRYTVIVPDVLLSASLTPGDDAEGCSCMVG